MVNLLWHYPMDAETMALAQQGNKFEVWQEGWSATGQSAPARLIGVFEATTFQDACDQAAKQEGWSKQWPCPENGWLPGGCYNAKHRISWGCRLFDNEADAREFLG